MKKQNGKGDRPLKDLPARKSETVRGGWGRELQPTSPDRTNTTTSDLSASNAVTLSAVINNALK